MRGRLPVPVRVVCALLVLTAALASSAFAASGEVSILFLVHGKAGTIVHRAGAGKSTYRVTMRIDDPYVIAFTDRPARKANHATLAQFIAHWATSDFRRSPPNAALVLGMADGSEQAVVATMTHPVLSRGGKTLSFDATMLPDVTSHTASVYAPRPTSTPPARFVRATLFVDANITRGPPPPPKHVG